MSKYTTQHRKVILSDGDKICEDVHDAEGRRLAGKVNVNPVHAYLVDNSEGTEDVTLSFASRRMSTPSEDVIIRAGQFGNFSSQHDGEISQDVTVSIPNGATVPVIITEVGAYIKKRIV